MDPASHSQAGSRAEIAEKSLVCCRLCPRNCAVDRIAGQKGYCRLDADARCFREVLHWGEEKELNPSHQVYFAGCNLRCEFCTVAEWNESPEAAKVMDVERLAAVIAERKKQGARTLNLLGGEPAVSVHGIIKLLSRLDASTLVVWNSNMYYNSIVDELMAGLIDICLADLKCGNADCSNRLLDSADYVEVTKNNILRAVRHCDVIVRYLVLPGHTDCCLKPILKWLSAEAPNVKLSLRGNYVPPVEANTAPMRYLKPEELKQAGNLAAKMGLTLVK
jgi:putative pyruvate formate lyase activating enzyme